MRWMFCAAAVLLSAGWTGWAWGIDGANVESLIPVNIAGNDWKTFELITGNDSTAALAGGGGFSWAGRTTFDGIGAFALDASTIRVFVNHETTPALISYFDLHRTNLRNLADQATGTTWAGSGQVVTGIGNGWTYISGDPSLSRFCSANLWEPDTFRAGRGFADRLFLTNEEVAGGQYYALDPATQTLHQAPALGSGSWESAAPIDTGRTDTIALLLAEDAGAAAAGTSPLRLYVGQKNPGGTFLQRNGLEGGKVYYWDPDGTANTNGTIDGPLFDTDANAATNASGNTVTGTWVLANTTAALFSKMEDIHVKTKSSDPAFGKAAVFAAQDEGLYHVDLTGLSFVLGDLGPAQQSQVKLLLQATFDQDPNGVLQGCDNVVWSPDGLVYINEDGSNGEVWQLDPANPGASALNIVDLNTAIALETSGIVDISDLLGLAPGSLFLTDAQSGTLANNQLELLVSPLVPEPATGAVIGLLPLIIFRRRRRSIVLN